MSSRNESIFLNSSGESETDSSSDESSDTSERAYTNSVVNLIRHNVQMDNLHSSDSDSNSDSEYYSDTSAPPPTPESIANVSSDESDEEPPLKIARN